MTHAACSRLTFHHAASDLDGLPEAALSQDLSVDEVRRPEDAVRPLGHHAQWFWSTYVLLIGARWLVNAVASTGGVQARFQRTERRKRKKSGEHPTVEGVLAYCFLLHHLLQLHCCKLLYTVGPVFVAHCSTAQMFSAQSLNLTHWIHSNLV